VPESVAQGKKKETDKFNFRRVLFTLIEDATRPGGMRIIGDVWTDPKPLYTKGDEEIYIWGIPHKPLRRKGMSARSSRKKRRKRGHKEGA